MAEPFIGEIRLMSFDYAPRYWATCDGQLVPVHQNQALFALLGTTYGGDGINNFGLPDLRGRAAMHFSVGYFRGERGGLEYVPLTAGQVGPHSHAFHCTNNNANYQGPQNRFFAKADVPVYTRTLTNLKHFNPQSMVAAGSSVPHFNMQPSLVMNYCISLQGIFPTRD
jgi:microcystin-dependent protein